MHDLERQRLTTDPDPTRLLDVDVVIFDFDGTLYEGTDFVPLYLDILQAAVEPDVPELAALQRDVLAGRHVLQLGDLFHFATRSILRPEPEPPQDRLGLRIAQVLDLEGAASATPSDLEGCHVGFDAPVTYVGDPWQISAAISHAFGIEESTRRDAFESVRHTMNGPDYDLGVPPCLSSLLDRFAHVPDRILVTNTSADLASACVDKVGVTDRFTEIVFGAAKPMGLARLITDRVEAGADPGRMLCVGDNYWNDILPAYQLGAQSVLIDPLDIDRVSDAPLHLRELAQLEAILAGATTSAVDIAGGGHR